jgi:hypothetical protein
MSKLTESYKQVTIESAISAADMKKALSFNKNAATLYDSDKNPVFMVSYGKSASANANGIGFTDVTGDGKMFVTFPESGLPAETPKKREAILEKYAPVLFHLNQVEVQITAAIAGIADQVAAVEASIHLS